MVEVYAENAREAMAAWQEVRGESATWGEYRKSQARGLQFFIESSLKEAIDRKIGVRWYARSDGRDGHRNGFYKRTVVTPYGTVDVLVPRLRQGSYEHDLFDKNGLLTKEAQDLILDTYLAGPSQRRVGMVLKRVLGYKVSASTVSAICKGLDELVRKYWRAPIGDNWKYLLLDAIVMKNRACTGSEKRFVLVAVGISKSGKRRILSFKQVESESEVCWGGFVDDLVRRGLVGENLELITTDGNPGLLAAIQTAWPHARRQRCWVHKLRNVAGKLKRRNQKACLDQAKLIYLAKNQTEARRRFLAWRDRWIAEEPAAVACLEKDIEEMLEFFALPPEDWVMMRTTNGIERVFREVRRRTRTISCFTNRRSVDRMMFAVLAYQNEQWEASYQPKQFTHKA